MVPVVLVPLDQGARSFGPLDHGARSFGPLDQGVRIVLVS